MIKLCESINGESILVSSIIGEKDKGIFIVCPEDEIIYIKFVSVDRFELKTIDGSLYFRAKSSEVQELLEGKFITDGTSQVYFNPEFVRQINTINDEILVSSFKEKQEFERIFVDNAQQVIFEYRKYFLEDQLSPESIKSSLMRRDETIHSCICVQSDELKLQMGNC